jgi:hypothetical protein
MVLYTILEYASSFLKNVKVRNPRMKYNSPDTHEVLTIYIRDIESLEMTYKNQYDSFRDGFINTSGK